jgi:hypothetical protein
MLKLLLVLLIFLTTVFALHSQGTPLDPDQYLYNTWTTRDGLTQNTVYCMVRDSRGMGILKIHEGTQRNTKEVKG